MGLVNPRPAMRGAEERSVRRNLEAHAIRMNELIAQGMTPEAASKQALQDILGKKPRKKPGPKPGSKKTSGVKST